jgi:hypothetical protein
MLLLLLLLLVVGADGGGAEMVGGGVPFFFGMEMEIVQKKKHMNWFTYRILCTFYDNMRNKNFCFFAMLCAFFHLYMF